MLPVTKSFAKIHKIRDDVKPLAQLWKIARQFNQYDREWKDSLFLDLKADFMEDLVSDWKKHFSNFKNHIILIENYQPNSLLIFL